MESLETKTKSGLLREVESSVGGLTLVTQPGSQHKVLKILVNAFEVHEQKPVRLNHVSRHTYLELEQQSIWSRYDLW